MVQIRTSAERGRSSTGWIHSAHSFSFGPYFDTRHQGHGNLLVLNEDIVAPGKGFATHAHRDMEIITYVLDGALIHKDRMRTDGFTEEHVGIVLPGDVQRMTAGSGVQHSEFNHLADREVHFLQIWIKPLFTGIRPSHEQKHFPESQRRGRLARIASRTGEHGAVSMNADASIEAGLFDGHESIATSLDPARVTYVHLARGALTVNGQRLSGGDGALLDGETTLTMHNGLAAEVLVFDLTRN